MRNVLGSLLFSVISVIALMPFSLHAEPGFSPAQKQQIENIIRDYLLKHPELLLEMSAKLEAIQKAEAERKLKKSINDNKEQLFYSDDDFVVNPEGIVPMVEFFDYQCTYCKRVLSSVMKVAEDEKDVRVAFKEYPVLGPMSVYAAKASIAAKMQGKYMEFHRELMSKPGKLTKRIVLDIAGKVGLDLEKLRKDIKDPATTEIIQRNLKLGRIMDVRGTPTLVIGENFVPGAISLARMTELIEQTRLECAIC